MTTITVQRALLEQAIEALEIATDNYDDSAIDLEVEAIFALRDALEAPATAPDLSAAYIGAREDLAIWKKRALEAEETARQLNRALAEEVNGPTFMGEPVLPATAPATTSIEDHTLERLLDAWDTTVLPKHRDGAMQEWMEALRHEFTTCPDHSITGRVTDMNSGLDPDTETDDRHAQELLAQDITLQNMAERHAQELCAYQVTVDKLRAERKPMTEECIKELYGDSNFDIVGPSVIAFVRAVEAFHGIKELAPAGSELPTNSADQAEVTSTGQVPAWHDAPTVPGLWVCRQAITDNVQAYEVTDQMALNRNLKLKGQWYGPIPEDRQ